MNVIYIKSVYYCEFLGLKNLKKIVLTNLNILQQHRF